MKILLLQSQVHVPSWGGGNKANRMLLEALVRKGHPCAVVCPALTTRAGPGTEAEFRETAGKRGIEVAELQPGVFRSHYRGVEVDSMSFSDAPRRRQHILHRIEQFRPDWILVTDDKQKLLLDCALSASPERTIVLVQTIVQLPFGPLAAEPSARQSEGFRQARAIIVISEYARDYVKRHLGVESCLVRLPVYGEGPFPFPGNERSPYVTLVNPCVEKGLPIFLALARRFPAQPFAAVPTWGADAHVLRELAEVPNVCLLDPADDIDEVLAETRVLLAPSLWPETFGYVVVEAMLRGIPVLASNIGGLPEAKLGVDYLLPVVPAERRGSSYVSPAQDIAPWTATLAELLEDTAAHARCSRKSRDAALAYVSEAGVASFERMLAELEPLPRGAPPVR